MPEPDLHILLKGDLGAMIRDEKRQFSVLNILSASIGGSSLRLVVVLVFENGQDDEPYRTGVYEIHCQNDIDFAIRPKNPACMEGGPAIEYYEEHPRLTDSLQWIPGGDGEVFDPPKKFAVLIVDQSYVIAEAFHIREYARPQ